MYHDCIGSASIDNVSCHLAKSTVRLGASLGIVVVSYFEKMRGRRRGGQSQQRRDHVNVAHFVNHGEHETTARALVVGSRSASNRDRDDRVD